jgi:hypothetical protein
MDLLAGLPSTARGSEADSSGNKKRKSEEEIKYKDFLCIISKLVLNSAMQLRIHKAIIIDCYKIKAEGQWYTSHVEATRSFAVTQSQLKEQGQTPQQIKEAIGMPSVHGFNAMVKHLLTLKIPEAAKVRTAVSLWQSQDGWRTIAYHIKCCRMTKMYHATDKRLEISVPQEPHTVLDQPDDNMLTPTWVWLLIKREMMKEKDYIQMEGVAPSGDMERKIQEWLDANSK